MAVAVSDAAHFRLLAVVRWQLFRNSLRVGFKRMEVLIRALTWVLGVAVVSLTSVAFFLNGYFLFPKRPLTTHVLLWVVAFGWQVLPLVLEGSLPALDFRELARYPIRFRLFYLMSVAYGLLDPVALACVVWLVSLALGIMFAQPWTIPWVLLFLPLFALLNLLFNRVLLGWLRQVTATRQKREILVAVGISLLVVLQVAFFLWMPRVEDIQRKQRVASAATFVDRYSPMGMTANAISQPRAHALPALATLGGGCLVLGLLLYRQLRPMYLGEMESDSQVRSGAIQVEPGWQLPLAGPQLSAMVEREMRYFFRESRLWVNQASAWAFTFVAATAPAFLQQAFHWTDERRGELLYPIAVSYSLMVLATLAYNCFWSDAGGYYRWLLSPVSMRRVLLAKNIFFGLLALVNFVVVTAIVSIGMPVPAARLLNAFLATIFLALGVVSGGNLTSGWFPKKVQAGVFNSRNASEAATLIGLVTIGTLSTAAFAATWAAQRWQEPLLAPFLLLLLIALAVGGYLLTLQLAAEYLDRQQDKMCAELV